MNRLLLALIISITIIIHSLHRGDRHEMSQKKIHLSKKSKTTSISKEHNTKRNIQRPLNTNLIIDNNSKCINLLSQFDHTHCIMIVLCGIPGAGKSTFASKLIQNISSVSIESDKNNHNNWMVFNQDLLGSRQEVITHTIEALQARKCIIIDRCNHNKEQRKHWIELGHEYNVDTIISFLLPDYLNYEICSIRAIQRGNDGIHEDNVDWNHVCNIMQRQFTYPTIQEGFSSIYQCMDENDIHTFIHIITSITNSNNKVST